MMALMRKIEGSIIIGDDIIAKLEHLSNVRINETQLDLRSIATKYLLN